MGFIYVISNDINDHVYVGQTRRTIDQRWQQHISDSKKSNAVIYRAMRKYGVQHFSISEIEECPDEELNDREIYWIDYYNSYYNGYNSTLGGQGAQTINYDAIIETFMTNHNITATAKELNIGLSTVRDVVRKHKIEYDKDRSLPKKIEMIDPETKQVIQTFSSINEASLYNENWQRETIRDAVSGRRKSVYGYFWKEIGSNKTFDDHCYKHSRKIAQKDKKTLAVITTFDSIQAANRAMGKPENHKSISNMLNGRAKTALGYVWEYID